MLIVNGIKFEDIGDDTITITGPNGKVITHTNGQKTIIKVKKDKLIVKKGGKKTVTNLGQYKKENPESFEKEIIEKQKSLAETLIDSGFATKTKGRYEVVGDIIVEDGKVKEVIKPDDNDRVIKNKNNKISGKGTVIIGDVITKSSKDKIDTSEREK